jgi:hypothetical protein
MEGLHFLPDYMKKGIEPAKYPRDLQKHNIQGMHMLNMIQFVPQYLLAGAAAQFLRFIPENTGKEGKRCSFIRDKVNLGPMQFAMGVVPAERTEIKQGTIKPDQKANRHQ